MLAKMLLKRNQSLYLKTFVYAIENYAYVAKKSLKVPK